MLVANEGLQIWVVDVRVPYFILLQRHSLLIVTRGPPHWLVRIVQLECVVVRIIGINNLLDAHADAMVPVVALVLRA